VLIGGVRACLRWGVAGSRSCFPLLHVLTVVIARHWVVFDFSDPSSSHLVQLMLPLAGFYMAASNFVAVHSRFEYGLVHHAFCAAIQALLKVRVCDESASLAVGVAVSHDEPLCIVSQLIWVGRNISSCWRNSRRNKGVRVLPYNAYFITFSRLCTR
jgi:hypothetical protein